MRQHRCERRFGCAEERHIADQDEEILCSRDTCQSGHSSGESGSGHTLGRPRLFWLETLQLTPKGGVRSEFVNRIISELSADSGILHALR